MMTGGTPILGNLHIFKAAESEFRWEHHSGALRNATDQRVLPISTPPDQA